MRSLSSHQVALECMQTLGEEILSSCHPDSVITIKSWISVTKTRYEEVRDYSNIYTRRLLEDFLKLFLWSLLVIYVCVYTCMTQVQTWAQQQAERIQAALSALEAERMEVQHLLNWISSAEESLNLRDQESLPDDIEQTAELITQHTVEMVTYLHDKQMVCATRAGECNLLNLFVGFHGWVKE